MYEKYQMFTKCASPTSMTQIRSLMTIILIRGCHLLSNLWRVTLYKQHTWFKNHPHMQSEGLIVKVPHVDVKAIFGWKVCSMIIQGKWYLRLQMLTGCHWFLGNGACYKFPTFSSPSGQLTVSVSEHSEQHIK